MKKRDFILNIVLVIVISCTTLSFLHSDTIVSAKKPEPTPTVDPYTPPNSVQSYPEPGFPFPGNPPPNKAFVWGMYPIDTWRWYVSKYTATADPDATITLCIAQNNPYEQVCFRHRTGYSESLQYVEYRDGMSLYQSIPMSSIPVSPCGWWGAMPDTSSWNGEYMELHQPNWYLFPCTVWANPIWLPVTFR